MPHISQNNHFDKICCWYLLVMKVYLMTICAIHINFDLTYLTYIFDIVIRLTCPNILQISEITFDYGTL